MELGINLPGLIIQVINVALIILILRALLYKPVIRMLDRRSERIKESLEAAERQKQESLRAEEEVKKELDQARQEGQVLIGQATQIADRLKEEAREGARREAEAIINRARSEIQRERDEAVEQVRQQFADLTIVAAEKVIRKSLDKSTHQELIEEVLREGTTLGKN